MNVEKMLLGKINGAPVVIVPDTVILAKDVMRVRLDAHIVSANDKTEVTEVAVIPWGEWETEVKAAENKRGEEVLELAKKAIYSDGRQHAAVQQRILSNLLDDYQERFGLGLR